MLPRIALPTFLLFAAVLVFAGCENRAETVRQQLLGTWSLAGSDSFRSTTAGQQYTFEEDGTYTVRERRRLGPASTLRAAYEIARDGSLTLRDAAAAQRFTPSFAGDTLRLQAIASDDALTLIRRQAAP
ncbi:MAG: hypothetical protein AAF624_11815 [Bacteroidota bacterium]